MSLQLWTEKYRPKKINDIILSDTLKFKIKNLIDLNILPHIIISGPPGTGKTSTILAIAKKIYGNKYNEAVMELNASDNRGLEIINNSIIYFCRKKLTFDDKPLQKLIIMDEADNITKKAQKTISNMMEEYGHNTKFAFTCNDSNKLIESIQSRCFLIFYPPLKNIQITNCLEKICLNENINYDNNSLEILAKNSRGDIRQAINNLEALYYGFGNINSDNIYQICHQPQPDNIIKIIQECAARNLNNAILMINDMKNKGYCANDILLTMINIIRDVNIDEEIRLKYIKIISETYINVCDGVDSNLQLYGCLARMVLI